MSNIKNKVSIALVGSLALAVVSLSLCGYSVYSIFSSNQAEKVDAQTGKVMVHVDEDAPFAPGQQPENGYKTVSKTFRIVSDGNQRTYTRVALFPSIECYNDETGNWDVLGALSLEDITFQVNEDTLENWEKADDGYYYYTKVLTQDAETTDFNISKIELGSVPIEYKDFSLRINMYVQAEGIQATNEAYKINWGLEELPDNIESIPSYMDDAEITKIPSKPEDQTYSC